MEGAKPLNIIRFYRPARRKEFWSFWLFMMIAPLVLMYLDTVLGLGGSATSYRDGNSVGFSMSGGLLSAIFGLAMLIPGIAVAVRRLHDVGKSGWFLLFAFIPFRLGLSLYLLHPGRCP